MIQVYKKNELFIIENTVTDIIYPNLTREEALVLLEKFDRNETEHRCDFAIKEDDISFEYASLDDKDKTIAEQRKQITDLEAKLAEKDAERELDNSFWKQECDSLQKTLAEKEREIDNLYDRLNSKQKFYEMSLEKDYKEYLSRLDKLEKQCDKDKISFAVKQLEKVKNKIESKAESIYKILDDLNIRIVDECTSRQLSSYEEIVKDIDNQINELKEMK